MSDKDKEIVKQLKIFNEHIGWVKTNVETGTFKEHLMPSPLTIEMIGNIKEDVDKGFKGICARLDILNGQTAKNTQLRIRFEPLLNRIADLNMTIITVLVLTVLGLIIVPMATK